MAKIAVMGAGGVGGYLGARLADVGNSVVFVARGKHLEAIQSSGLSVESQLGNVHLKDVQVTEHAIEKIPVDLCFICCKNG